MIEEHQSTSRSDGHASDNQPKIEFLKSEQSQSTDDVVRPTLDLKRIHARSAASTLRAMLTLRFNHRSNGILYEAIRRKWASSLLTLPIASDLPRLAPKTQVSLLGRVLHQPQPDGGEFNITKVLSTLLTSIATLVENTSEVERLVKIFNQYLRNEVGDVSTLLTDMFSKSINIPDQSPTAAIIKLINLGVVAPAVLHLKALIGSKFPFKDARNAWFVYVSMQENERVSVTHTKWERSHRHNWFEFQWALDISLDKSLRSIADINLYITEVVFGDDMPVHERKRLLKCMQDYLFLPPGSTANSLLSSSSSATTRGQIRSTDGNKLFASDPTDIGATSSLRPFSVVGSSPRKNRQVPVSKVQSLGDVGVVAFSDATDENSSDQATGRVSKMASYDDITSRAHQTHHSFYGSVEEAQRSIDSAGASLQRPDSPDAPRLAPPGPTSRPQTPP